MQKRNLATWRNNEEGLYKQLDYIIVSNKQKNCATQVRAKGAANPNSANRRQLPLLKIRIRVKIEQAPPYQNHIQFDIDTPRCNHTILKEDPGPQQIHTLIPSKSTLDDAGMQRDNIPINKWNTLAFPSLENKITKIQKRNSHSLMQNHTKDTWGKPSRGKVLQRHSYAMRICGGIR